MDAAGADVVDLQLPDFELFQDGRKQRLVFVEPRQQARPSGDSGPDGARTGITPGRRIVIIVDDLHMTFDGVARVRDELLAAVVTNLRPLDQVMIVGTRAAIERRILLLTSWFSATNYRRSIGRRPYPTKSLILTKGASDAGRLSQARTPSKSTLARARSA